MTSVGKVQWAEDRKQDIASVDELIALLKRLHHEHKGKRGILVHFESAKDGATLSIGVGRKLSVLSYVPGSGDPPYLVSLGDYENGERILVFLAMGHWTEFQRRNAIPFALALEAMAHFCATGTLSEKVLWEEV